jgi:hypothetical protein
MNSMVDETNLIRILRENHIKSKIWIFYKEIHS